MPCKYNYPETAHYEFCATSKFLKDDNKKWNWQTYIAVDWKLILWSCFLPWFWDRTGCECQLIHSRWATIGYEWFTSIPHKYIQHEIPHSLPEVMWPRKHLTAER